MLRSGGTSKQTGMGGHPPGLRTLFFTELWERFSYYGMRAMLILYMVAPPSAGGLGLDTVRAAHVYGLYTGSVYFTALPGGWIADRFLGARRAVLYGGILIALGHYAMALGGGPLFYGALVLIVLGTGLLKPNISSMVGALYEENDPRRDAGFSIFYMGINLGAMISPLVCGYLGQRIDWHLGFGAAGVGMTLGLAQYVWSRARLAGIGDRPERRVDRAQAPASGATERHEAGRIAAIGVLFLFATVFWAAFEQAGSSLSLFAQDLTDNRILGLAFPSSWFQSVNALFIILLAPVFSWIWIRLGDRQPSSPAKFTLGLVSIGVGFVVVTAAASLADGGRVSPGWLVTVYLCNTVGELCLSPVGLSTVTKLAPARLAGLMMGVWFLSIAAGSYAGGWTAGFFDAAAPGALVRLFGSVALTALAAGAVLWVLTPFIRRLMHGVR
jgi:POT family proton-dependent oligopeptide transporter